MFGTQTLEATRLEQPLGSRISCRIGSFDGPHAKATKGHIRPLDELSSKTPSPFVAQYNHRSEKGQRLVLTPDTQTDRRLDLEGQLAVPARKGKPPV